MGEFFFDLTKVLSKICPTFLTLPLEVEYPHITVEPTNSLTGLPWGPTVLNFRVKIWSRYIGTKEILKMAKNVEAALNAYKRGSLKVMKSSLSFLEDGHTRVHTFQVKARIQCSGAAV